MRKGGARADGDVPSGAETAAANSECPAVDGGRAVVGVEAGDCESPRTILGEAARAVDVSCVAEAVRSIEDEARSVKDVSGD